MARIIPEQDPLPSQFKTLTETMSTGIEPATPNFFPAAIAATCVPLGRRC